MRYAKSNYFVAAVMTLSVFGIFQQPGALTCRNPSYELLHYDSIDGIATVDRCYSSSACTTMQFSEAALIDSLSAIGNSYEHIFTAVIDSVILTASMDRPGVITELARANLGEVIKGSPRESVWISGGTGIWEKDSYVDLIGEEILGYYNGPLTDSTKIGIWNSNCSPISGYFINGGRIQLVGRGELPFVSVSMSEFLSSIKESGISKGTNPRTYFRQAKLIEHDGIFTVDGRQIRPHVERAFGKQNGSISRAVVSPRRIIIR